MTKAVRDNLRRALRFAAWCFAVMLGISTLYELAYLSVIPREDYLRSLGVTVACGAAMASGLWIAFGALELIAIATRQVIRRSISGLTSDVVASTIGANIGVYFGEVVKLHLVRHYVWVYRFDGFGVLEGALIGLVFVFVTHFFIYRRRYHALAAASRAAQRQVLQAQMQPHFLLNTLNGVVELMVTDPEQASAMVHELAELYVDILRGSECDTWPLQSELSLVRKYLQLEARRYNERLHFAIDAASDTGEVAIPSLLLQTLVENAIKHGVAKSVSGGAVRLSIQREQAAWAIAVHNTGEALPPRIVDGVGLRNTRRRLELLYGGRAGFRLQSEAGETVAAFWIPDA